MSPAAEALLDGLASVVGSLARSGAEPFDRLKGYQDAINGAYVGDVITRDEWVELCHVIWEMLFGWEPQQIGARDAA